MVPETVFYMDIEEAGTVRGYSFKREDEECSKF